MTELREHSGVLVVVRCWCGIQHGIPESLRNERLIVERALALSHRRGTWVELLREAADD
jgi:hypothetical protein